MFDENLVTPSRLAAILLEHVGPYAQFVSTTGLTHIVSIDIETDVLLEYVDPSR